jgi:ribosomal protein S12 methylthiotransferase
VLSISGPQDYASVMSAVHAALPPKHDPFLGPAAADRRQADAEALRVPEDFRRLQPPLQLLHHPSMRGDLVSRRSTRCCRKAEALVRGGVKELLSFSQDTSAYGVDTRYAEREWRGKPYQTRMKALCEGLSELGAWTRLHYVYPYPHVDDVVPLMAEGRILPYLDIPFQHASPRILKLMKRPGAVDKTLERIRRWRDICPDITIRSTFIVGFPGETEAEFEELLDFLEEAELDRVGAFAYSPVDGAAANALPDPVPEDVKRERLARFMELQSEISAGKLQRKVGTTQQVLVDAIDGELAIARSMADAPEIDGLVQVQDGAAMGLKPGQFAQVRIMGADEHDLYAWPATTRTEDGRPPSARTALGQPQEPAGTPWRAAQPAALPAADLGDQPGADAREPRPARRCARCCRSPRCTWASSIIDEAVRLAGHPPRARARCRSGTAAARSTPCCAAGAGIRPGRALGRARPHRLAGRLAALRAAHQRHQRALMEARGDAGPGGLRGQRAAGPLDRARRQTMGRMTLMTQLFGQAQDLVTVVSFAAGLLVYAPWLMLLLAIALVPAFLGEAHFNALNYSLNFAWTPERRELEYIRQTGASVETGEGSEDLRPARLPDRTLPASSRGFYAANRRLALSRAWWGSLLTTSARWATTSPTATSPGARCAANSASATSTFLGRQFRPPAAAARGPAQRHLQASPARRCTSTTCIPSSRSRRISPRRRIRSPSRMPDPRRLPLRDVGFQYPGRRALGRCAT